MSKTPPDGGHAAARPSGEPHGAPDAEAAALAELAQDYQTHCAPCFLGQPEHCTAGLAPHGQPCVTTPAQRIAWLLDVVQQVVAQRSAAAGENAALTARLAAVEARDGRWRALVGELLAAYSTWLVAGSDAGYDLPTAGMPRLLAAFKAADAALADAPSPARGATEYTATRYIDGDSA